MKSVLRPGLWVFLFHATAAPLPAMVTSSHAAFSSRFETADAVFEGHVVSAESFITEDDTMRTRFLIQPEMRYKGTVPPRLTLTLPGGVVGRVGQSAGCQPGLKPGQRRIFFVSYEPGASRRTADPTGDALPGQRSTAAGEARLLSVAPAGPILQDTGPLTGGTSRDSSAGGPQAVSSSATNLTTDVDGIGHRFSEPDRAVAIPYIVDMDAKPAGLSTNQCLLAVSNALAAWEAVSPVRFDYRGIQSLGLPANSLLLPPDGLLRIQLHDLYNQIGSPSTLGIGGSSWWTDPDAPADWGTGGEVYGNAFHESTRGYVILKHAKTNLQSPLTLEEVLCHEVGHALGMAHSTPDTPAAPGTPAYEAQMYYIAHEDGRGASPTSWDTNVLYQVHPTDNSPPYLFDRVMDIVTQPSGAPSVPGINEIVLAAYDLQTTNLSVAAGGGEADAGTFSLASSTLSYTPGGFFGAPRVEPPDGGRYEIIYTRCSDGTHASALRSVSVVSFNPDRYPTPSDGLPDAWMTDYFGNPNPAVGIHHGANDDKDQDTLTNLEEFRAWMNPTNTASAQVVRAAADGTVSWQGKAYELYELHGSTNGRDWFLVKAVLATNDTPAVKVDPADRETGLYRVKKVP